MIGAPELIAAFIVAFLLFGPKKFPELARSLGRSVGEFKKARIAAGEGEVDASIKRIAHELDVDTGGKTDEEILDEVQQKLLEIKY